MVDKEDPMRKVDLRKDYSHLYSSRAGRVELLEVPPLRFVMIDGAIEKGHAPGDSPSFAEVTQALYGACYTMKFAAKKRSEDPVDYPVMALEGLWWVSDGVFDLEVKDNWVYTLMIMQPEFVDDGELAAAIEALRKKKGDSPALSRLRLATFDEGSCVQAMHIGPYSTEPETIARMRDFLAANGLRDRVGPRGKHHEIYLGDPRKSAPSTLKTILRHPVEKN
jgi:hypothetical protein